MKQPPHPYSGVDEVGDSGGIATGTDGGRSIDSGEELAGMRSGSARGSGREDASGGNGSE